MDRKDFRTIYFEWIKTKRGTIKEASLATYLTFADRHLLPVFGNRTSITEADVSSFVNNKLADGMSRNTVKGLLMVLRMIEKFGMRHGWTDYHGWQIRMPRCERLTRLPVLSLHEQRRMMDFLQQNVSFRNLGLYICLCTGMRIGEICALQWGDISFETRVIKVRRTIERIYSEIGEQPRTRIIISVPKTVNSLRDIPLSADLVSMLKPFMRIIVPSHFVITNSVKPLEPRLYRRYYYCMMKKIGLPTMKFHGLRHTFATRCIESQCDYKTVSSILGHANITTTMNLYVHPDIEQKRRCIDKMLKKVKS